MHFDTSFSRIHNEGLSWNITQSNNKLTDATAIRVEAFVCEAKDFGKVVKIGVLDYHIPLGVVPRIVSVANGELHSPIRFVILLHMPMEPDGAHVICAMNLRCGSMRCKCI